MEHLNNVFTESLSNSTFQSIDEHMYKFKGRSSIKQYMKNKLNKWALNIGINGTVKQVASIN